MRSVQKNYLSEEAFAIRGVIEGFYGPPWSHKERLDFLNFMAQHNMNMFIFSPKDEPLLRYEWAKLPSESWTKRVQELRTRSEELGIRFAVAVSPGLSIRYSNEDDRAKLMGKLHFLANMGVRDFGLFLDDIPSALQWPEDQKTYSSLAQAHRSLVLAVHESLSAIEEFSLMVCPETYWGSGKEQYLAELSQGLPSEINIMWTGKSICSATLEAADALTFAETTGRPPLYWDNYPVNDVAMSHELHLGPYERREPALHNTSRGILVNAMQMAEASKIAIATAGDFLADPYGYESEESWVRAIDKITSNPKDAEAFRAFASNSRSSCLSLSDAREVDQALAALEFSNVSGVIEPGIEAITALANKFEDSSAHLLSENFGNQALIDQCRPWLDAFRIGAEMLRHLAKLAQARQLDSVQASELEPNITRLRATGKRVFGDSLDMFVEHLMSESLASAKTPLQNEER
ncbi:protein O-GlcNAcase [Candidatus Aquiluna sp. UB-MaderosW2red]|uniref:protein O-GlcNAcase n=1 Tax=Candidatus Aquiluna sp. UB-MaderosW2red TaxID=1855377 RepID=UPI000875B974|nr:protein O-GlcNAcase [Candidatus Aquiluna sp. UB-MaderosW2red]SCX03314.1 hyaluronoglucosaminidase [Candidatus Aquiluna sp. UB-MaderosW2red]